MPMPQTVPFGKHHNITISISVKSFRFMVLCFIKKTSSRQEELGQRERGRNEDFILQIIELNAAFPWIFLRLFFLLHKSENSRRMLAWKFGDAFDSVKWRFHKLALDEFWASIHNAVLYLQWIHITFVFSSIARVSAIFNITPRNGAECPVQRIEAVVLFSFLRDTISSSRRW